jgi:hypothetical protein
VTSIATVIAIYSVVSIRAIVAGLATKADTSARSNIPNKLMPRTLFRCIPP